ncbi:Stk1 family PASTA domain-containing Ser/Thr kinase [Saccharomonospora saliphila]|uniref:Stk1 family PASTA domain-containing Ser/Thr kinase n=1 Tax=Saccharomonospora saliphila TaxID=369829 RepID=UPI00035CEF26|nr:Stk1 family PASTA domain-containing Ser/Thr kinase [Saccharomonospora saliphila]
MSAPRLLSNRYELGDTLGYGGMSEVHHGHDIRLGREVAVKILRADLARDPQFQERFRREAQNAAALNHPAIVAVYDTGEADTEYGPLPYIVMEYVEGRTLRDIVKSEGPMPEKRAMEVMADVCAALDFSHRHGIVHRDVKPANVMITRNGAVKVMDFGIARAVHDGQAAMTQTAAVIGTAQYLSPEQARGETVDARSDVYSAGCVLYELITGDPPFTGDSPVAVAYQHVREQPEPPSVSNPEVSPELDAVVLTALAKGTDNRYQSAAEMRSDLVRTLSGQRPAAPMVLPEEEGTQVLGSSSQDRFDAYDPGDYESEDDARRRRRNRRLTAVVLTLVGLGLIAFVSWILGSSNQGEAETLPVPDVTGMETARAKETLQESGFTNFLERTHTCLANAPEGEAPCGPDDYGRVFETEPGARQQLAVDRQITLHIGVRPDKVEVPQLADMTREEAERALRDANLVLDPNIGEREAEDESDYGKVVEQDPGAGAMIEQGQSVSITVGVQPEEVQVPNMTGKPFEEARSTLSELGLEVKREDVDHEEPKGTVVNQEPNGGRVTKGSEVRLEVSNGAQAQIQVPDVTGMSEQDAVAALKNAGWTGSHTVETEQVSDSDDVGTVTNTNPAPGSSMAKNQSIVLYIGEDEDGSTETSETEDDGGGLFPGPGVGGDN